ncbi:hypothetical protein FB45DRAFT_337369 [Roridomyces roridus]|uniref:Uncharacterized protein n=1 Tax=Roridomyces roridus TaxID=1738132 RepID=A0AAD7FBC8_9AGAR|nr:hypothetical protein FB45DRAFT_337369 [Roridomyces roridus]
MFWRQEMRKLKTSQDLWIMHKMILLLLPTSGERGNLLKMLGDICLKQWNTTNGPTEALNQAVLAYDDGVREGLTDVTVLYPGKTLMLASCGNSLITLSEEVGNLEDLPDGNPNIASGLTKLGDCLITRFQQLGNLEDLHRSVLVREDAVHLTPEDHAQKAAMIGNLGCSIIM